MWDYKGSYQFDIGAGYGELEYDFFTINGKEDFSNLINYYRVLWKRFDYAEGHFPQRGDGLVEGYERLIASESLDVEGLRRITALRNELILTFRDLREHYAALLALRVALFRPLSPGPLGVPGPGPLPDPRGPALSLRDDGRERRHSGGPG